MTRAGRRKGGRDTRGKTSSGRKNDDLLDTFVTAGDRLTAWQGKAFFLGEKRLLVNQESQTLHDYQTVQSMAMIQDLYMVYQPRLFPEPPTTAI